MKEFREMKIEIPAGCDVEKIETKDGAVVVTFKEKKRKLPKSWEEFCRMNRETKVGESCIIADSSIRTPGYTLKRTVDKDKNLLPDRATAEAVLALCQLIQLRDCYNAGWKPDWKTNDEKKYLIKIESEEIGRDYSYYWASSLLYFKSEKLRDMFLKNFFDLIEKLKPLYGIKEGGEE